MKKQNKKNKVVKPLSLIIAAIVVFVTTYSLILPAITIEQETAVQMSGLDLEDAETIQGENAQIAFESVDPVEGVAYETTALDVVEANDAAASTASDAEQENADNTNEDITDSDNTSDANLENVESTDTASGSTGTDDVQNEDDNDTVITTGLDGDNTSDETDDTTSSDQTAAETAAQSDESSNIISETKSDETETTSVDESQSEEQTRYPAMTFESELTSSQSGVRTIDGKRPSVKVSVVAPEGALPEGTLMKAEEVTSDSKVDQAVRKTVDGEVRTFQAVDITFTSKDGEKIEPLKKIKVTISTNVIEAQSLTDEPVLVHIADNGAADLVAASDGPSAELIIEQLEAAHVLDKEKSLYSAGTDNALTNGTADSTDIAEGLKIDDSSSAADAAIKKAENIAKAENAQKQAAIETEKQTQAQSGTADGKAGTGELTTVTFDSNRFSVYAVVYTVDFSYSVNGEMYDFSLPGGEKIALSDLIEVLGIIRGTQFEDASEFISHISDVKFSNESLVKVTHKTPALGVFGDEDWVLESLQAFDTVETLTITMDNGEKVVIRVTDAQTINDLKQIATVTGITGAVQNGDGSYTVVAGEQYTVGLHFEETADLQLDMDGNVTYTLPSGFNPAGMDMNGTIELEVTGGQKAKATYSISGNTITFIWDKSDPNYEKLASSGYLTFDFELKGKFSETSEDLKFTDTTDGTVKVTNDGSLTIGKNGYYDAETNQVVYTVTVNGTGVNNNVNIKDAIASSGILTFDSSKGLEVTSSTGNTVSYTGGQSGNGFDITIGKIGNGETVTVKYYANVDLNAYKNLNGDEAKITATKNVVEAKSDHQTTITAEHSEPYINVSGISKSVLEKGEMDETGRQKITWRIEANQSANLPMGGQTITDSIAADSQADLKYSGTGITVYRMNKAGDYVGQPERISWDSLTKTDTSWSWTVPNSDTTPYRYLIEYETVADASSLTSNKTLTNNVEGGHGSSGSGQTVIGPVGGTADVTKKHTNVDLVNKEVTWEVVINVPKSGLSSCSLRESIPYLWDDSQQKAIYSDKLKSIDVISGLVDGESWSYEAFTDDYDRTYVDVTFKKTDDDGQVVDGLNAGSTSRKVRVQIVTTLDGDWLDYASANQTVYDVDKHTNRVILYADGEQRQAEDFVVIDTSKPSLTKSHDELLTSDSGKDTVMVKYYVALTGVNGDTKFPITLTDSFNSKYFSFQDITDTNYNQSNGYVFGTTLDTPKPSYDAGKNNRSSSRVVSETSPGTLAITINESDLPKNGGAYYPLYVVEYYLKVKDDATLLRLKNDAIQQDGGKLTFVNNVSSEDFGTATDTVEYEVPILDKNLSKEIALDQNTGTFKGTFQIDVNKDGKMIGDEGTLTLKDTTTNLSIVYDSIQVWEVGADNTTLTKCATATWNREGYNVVYTLPNQQHLRITYDVIVTGSGNVHWVNTAELNGQKVTKSGDKDLSSTGTGSAYTYGITILKHDKDDLTKTLPNATFAVYRWKGSQSASSETILGSSDLTKEGNADKWTHIKDITTGENGTFELNSETDSPDGYLRRDTWYMLVETKAPEGYEKVSYNPVFKITKDGNADYNNYVYVNGDTLAIRDSQIPPEKATIKVTKTWTGENGDTSLRRAVTVHLLADGAKPTGDDYAGFETDIVLNEGNNWTYTWTDLPGGPTYSVKEDAVPGYVTSYIPTKGIVQGGDITVVNSKRPNKTALHVEKEWSGSHVSIGDITLQVKRYVNPKVPAMIYCFDGANNEMYSIDYVSPGSTAHVEYQYGANGWEVEYKVYNASTNELLLSVDHVNDDTAKSGTMHVGESFTIPEDGVRVVFPLAKSNINQAYAFGDTKPQIVITGTGSGGTPVEDKVYTMENHTITLNADNNWQADIDNLVLSDEDGSYTYYVEETGMNDGTKTPEQAGYTVSYSNDDGSGKLTGMVNGTITVTNTKEDEYSLTLRKTITGNYNLTDAEKANITFTVTGPYQLGDETETTHTWTIPYSDFTNYRYILTSLQGITAGTYTVTESGADINGVERTTTYTINGSASENAAVSLSDSQKTGTVAFVNDYFKTKTKDITVTKAWNDEGYTAWPSNVQSVGVYLYANGKETGSSATLTEGLRTYTFKNLPETDADRNTIEYTVREKYAVINGEIVDESDGKVGEYTITGGTVGSDNTATITNSKDIEKTSATVEKKWSNKDGSSTWPAGLEVTMTLYNADDMENPVSGTGITNPVKLTADQQSYTWDDVLPKYKTDGTTEIQYIVKETAVTGYTAYATTSDGTEASDTASVIDGKASFTNRQKEGGEVAIQITKYLVDSEGNRINPMTDSENTFYIYKNPDAIADSVRDVNRTEYAPFSVSGYGTDDKDNAVSTAKVTVGSSGWGLVYDNELTSGMYTIVEDKDSISDEIIDSTGAVWKYVSTEMRTEYAWRTTGDENGRHYGGVSTKTSGNYTAVPEVAGAYKGEDGSDLYNGYLDFFVYNVYEKTDETVTSEKIDLQINKNWSKTVDGVTDTSAPTSGSVTFRIHQVKETTTTAAGADDGNAAARATVYIKNVYSGSVIDTVNSSALHVGDTVSLFTTSWVGNQSRSKPPVGMSNVSCTQVNDPQWGYKLTFTITATTVEYYCDTNPAAAKFSVLGDSGDTTTTTTEVDPAGSGFPKDVTITASNWSTTESDLLAKVVNGNETVTYSYYIEEVQRTGAAAAYTLASFNTGSSKDSAVTGEDGQTKTITATNSQTDSGKKIITIEKEWKDQSGNTLKDHPDEILFDVYRIKLPGGGAGDGTVSYDSIGNLYAAIGDPSTWVDDAENEVAFDSVFEYNGDYYYIGNGPQKFQRVQLQAWVDALAQGKPPTGNFITKLTGKIYTPEQIEERCKNNQYMTQGDLCYYNGEYYLYQISQSYFGHSEMQHAPSGEPDARGRIGNWARIGTKNILSGVNLHLHPNENELSEDEIKDIMDKNVYEYIQQELIKEGSNLTFTEEDYPLTLYQENVKITKADNWQTQYPAPNGYLYFFFEKTVPGYTTTYAYEDYGITEKDQKVSIINKRPVGELDITKEWSGETTGDKVYVKVYRNDVDITDVLAEKPENYSLTANDFMENGEQKYLVISKNGDAWNTARITDLPLAEYGAEATVDYKYVVQELGYHDEDGDHWGVSEILSGYESVYGDGTKTESSGAASTGVKVGYSTTETTTVTDSETGEEKQVTTVTTFPSVVTIKNTTESTTDFTVQKRWMLTDGSWLGEDYDASTKTVYYMLFRKEADGKYHQVKEDGTHVDSISEVFALTKNSTAKINLTTAETVTGTSLTNTTPAGERTVHWAHTFTDLPGNKADYYAIECTADGTKIMQDAEKFGADTAGLNNQKDQLALAAGQSIIPASTDIYMGCEEYKTNTIGGGPVLALKNDLTEWTVKKIWDDVGNTVETHPTVTVELFANVGNEKTSLGTKTISDSTETKDDEGHAYQKWEHLPIIDVATGKRIIYTATETYTGAGYSKTVNYTVAFRNELNGKTDPTADDITLKDYLALYTDGTLKDAPQLASGNQLVFTNKLETVEINVEKKWEGQIPDGATATLTLYRHTANSEEETVSSIVLNGKRDIDPTWALSTNGDDEHWGTGDNTNTATAHEDGAWHGNWEKLPKYKFTASGAEEWIYTVKETAVPDGWAADYGDGKTAVTPTLNERLDDQNVDKLKGELTNVKRIDIDLLKVDKNDETKKLPDAKFTLVMIDGDATAISVDTSTAQEVTTGADGKAKFTNVEPGFYRLTEDQAPAGYVITSSKTTYLKIESDGTISVLKYDEKEDKGTAPSTWDKKTLGSNDLISIGNKSITVKNEPGAELPASGGIGTTIFTILGSVLIAFAGVGLLIRKRRRTVG